MTQMEVWEERGVSWYLLAKESHSPCWMQAVMQRALNWGAMAMSRIGTTSAEGVGEGGSKVSNKEGKRTQQLVL